MAAPFCKRFANAKPRVSELVEIEMPAQRAVAERLLDPWAAAKGCFEVGVRDEEGRAKAREARTKAAEIGIQLAQLIGPHALAIGRIGNNESAFEHVRAGQCSDLASGQIAKIAGRDPDRRSHAC